MSAQQLLVCCSGLWPHMIPYLSNKPQVREAIENGPNKKVACPQHGGTSGKAFGIFKDFVRTGGAICNSCGGFRDGISLLQWLNDWDFRRTVSAIEAYLAEYSPSRLEEYVRSLDPSLQRHYRAKYFQGLSESAPRATQSASPPPASPTVALPIRQSPEVPDDRVYRPPLARLVEMWEEAFTLDHPQASPARRYLAKRGFATLDMDRFGCLRMHSRLLYVDSETGERVGYFPGLLARVLNSAEELVSLHRTFLTENGEKAPVTDAKKLYTAEDATASGAAVHLLPAGPMLGVSEGIETALAVIAATGMPIWPTISAGGMRAAVLPAYVRHVVIWADLDLRKTLKNGNVIEPGRDAAHVLADRLRKEERTVEIHFPSQERPCDWNDVWCRQGAAGFPLVQYRPRMLPTARSLWKRLICQ